MTIQKLFAFPAKYGIFDYQQQLINRCNMQKREVMSMVEMLNTYKKDFTRESKQRAAQYKKYKQRIELFYCFLQECLSIGYVPKYDEFDVPQYYGVEIKVDNLRDFSKIHKIVGTLVQFSIEPVNDDGRSRDVWVKLKPKDENHPFNFLKFVFKRKLPKGGKCKVKKVTRNYYSVVCER